MASRFISSFFGTRKATNMGDTTLISGRDKTKHINKRVPGFDTYYPLNEPLVGRTLPAEHYPQNKDIPALFKPIKLRNLTFHNRIFVAPMCQYSSDNGHATDWHLVHLGRFAQGGAGAIILEATAVVPEGRISPEDAGLWTDSQIAPLKRIVDFCHSQGTPTGIQLAHAGRKASTYAPWVHADPARSRVAPTYTAGVDENGWPDNVKGPSTLPYSDLYPTPKAMTETDMQTVQDAFTASAKRCIEAGFDFVEVHAAHGYLIHEWLSPLSNLRTDSYGGSLENRMKYPLQLIEAVRKAWPEDRPLLLRISATDFAAGPEKDDKGEWVQWGIEQSKIFTAEAVKLGIDFIDVSAGGNWQKQHIEVKPGYQVPFAEAIKAHLSNTAVGAVGLITEPQQANEIISFGQADVVLLAREFLRDPNFPLRAAQALGVAIKPPNQGERSWPKMVTPAKPEASVGERTKEQGSH